MSKTLRDRFEEKYRVNELTGCWDWTASKNLGYGQIWNGLKNKKPLFAHRVSYQLNVGEIPSNLVIDHMCRNRACVNPSHLRLLTRGENVLAGESIAGIKLRSSKCPNGHEYTEESTYKYHGHRICRICRRAIDKKRDRSVHAT